MQNILIAERIKTLAKEKSVSVKKLLEDCGIHKGFIYGLEKENKSPSCDNIVKIASYLNCSIDYLLTGKEKSNITTGNDELELLNVYRHLSQQGKEYIQQQMFMAKEVYKKQNLPQLKQNAG